MYIRCADVGFTNKTPKNLIYNIWFVFRYKPVISRIRTEDDTQLPAVFRTTNVAQLKTTVFILPPFTGKIVIITYSVQVTERN
jgi:hypothetical protein